MLTALTRGSPFAQAVPLGLLLGARHPVVEDSQASNRADAESSPNSFLPLRLVRRCSSAIEFVQDVTVCADRALLTAVRLRI